MTTSTDLTAVSSISMCRKRPAEDEDPKPEVDDLTSATSTPVKKLKPVKAVGTKAKNPKAKAPQAGHESSAKEAGPKGEGWGAERRLKLWAAFNACAEVKWDEVAEKVSAS